MATTKQQILAALTVIWPVIRKSVRADTCTTENYFITELLQVSLHILD
jgi:hypothetical protein